MQALGTPNRKALSEYVERLAKCRNATSYIELNREKECAYMEEHRYRFDAILDSLPNSTQSLHMLDIGATPFTIFLKEAYPHYRICTLDRTDLMEKRCRAKGVEFWTCDLDQASIAVADGCFDVVIFTEVLEHVFAPPTEVLREIRRVMRDGSLLILSVPNIATLPNRIRLLLGRTPLTDADDQMKKDWVHGHGHLHEYTMDEITSVLKRAGFTILRRQFLHAPARYTPRTVQPARALEIVRAIHRLAKVLVHSFRGTLYLECRK